MPPTTANCCAIIPCLNEAAGIGDLVRQVRTHLPTVVVVDDGSTDGTAKVAEAVGATVLRHGSPQGKGAALATGWSWAGERAFSWVLMLDGDGQHVAGDIPRLLAEAEQGVAKLIIGNRMRHPGAMPWLRRWANRWLSARLSELAGVDLPDSQCGFRLAHLPTLAALALRTRHFEIESEMCVAFARAGHHIRFVPVQVRYADECSKISPLRDYGRWWRWYQETRGVRSERPVMGGLVPSAEKIRLTWPVGAKTPSAPRAK